MGLPSERYLRPRLWVALALSVPVFLLAMGGMVPALAHRVPAQTSAWLQCALTTPVFFWCGRPFLRRWWKSLRERDPNMFTLIVTGTGAAFFYSVAAVLWGDRFPETLRTAHGVPLYFEATAVITTIVLIGQILEQRAHARTDVAVRALLQLAPKGAHPVRGDAEMLHRVFDNLLRNALKHAASGGWVGITLTAVGDDLCVCVDDRGPGVPAADLARLFEPFYRGTQVAARTGHGLGLAIVRQIVDNHHGRIEAANRVAGGLCVRVHLPRNAAGCEGSSPEIASVTGATTPD